MRQLKDIRTATAKRDKIKRAAEKKPAFKKPVAKPAPKPKKEVPQFDSELDSRKKAYKASDEILQDAFNKAKEIVSQTLRERDEARQIERTANDLMREAKKLALKLAQKAEDNKTTKSNLDTRDESIRVAEENVYKTRDQIHKVWQQSQNIERELAALLLASLTRLETMKTYESEVIKNMATLIDSLGKSLQLVKNYQSKQDDKEDHLGRISGQLNKKEAMMKEQRTQIRMAKKDPLTK